VKIRPPVKNVSLYILTRAGKLAAILVVVCLAAFLLTQASPVDPVRAYIGADMLLVGPAQQKIIAEKWGLDRPLGEKLFSWFTNLLKGDFGVSMIYNDAVSSVIAKRFTASLALMLTAWLLSGVIGFFLGLVSGAYAGGAAARVIDLYSYTLASTPAFWLGIVLLTFFSVTLGWTPVGGATPFGILPEEATFWQWLHHLLLPALTLSLVSVANVTLHTKEKVAELMRSDFVTGAVARGERKSGVILHHVARNALLPAVSLQFASIAEIFGGSVLVEQVFSYPGLGKATVEAGVRGDVPLLLGITIFSTIFIFCGNTIADLIYRAVDPRLRSQGGGR
jgi:peptide/nickel transport system permease protein